jgi:hypothetical protein
VKKRKRGALEKGAQAKHRQSTEVPKSFAQNTRIGRTESVKKPKRGALEKALPPQVTFLLIFFEAVFSKGMSRTLIIWICL